MTPARFAAPRLALVRPVPDSFDRALREAPAAIDVDRARHQHAGLLAAMRRAGVEVVTLPAADDLPDSCFVEDPAVVVGDRALITRSAVAARAPERDRAAAAIAPWCAVERMAAGALDGGDVLRIGARLYAGLTRRSDAAGIDALRAFARPAGLTVIAVPLAEGLHLKSAATLAAPGLLVHDPRLDPACFAATGVEALAADEPAGANLLALGDVVLVSAAAPGTARRLARRGLSVVSVAVDEFHKADGALTCLSLRLPAPGAWCV
jgi:dimethylargininase